MATVAIIGGGISGLSCAYYLKTLGHHKIRYMFLLEKNLKFGGWIQTTRFPDGAVFEHGPRTIRVGSKSGYNAIALADELNLASRILPVTKNHSLAKTNYILSNNELYPLPRDFKSMLAKTPPFSKALFLYGLKEMWTKKSEIDDESVYSFVERRVGQEIADFVFDPLCRGIAAGDARELSVRSMFPSLYEGEQQHGSFVKSLLKSRHDQPMFEYMYSDLVKKSCSEMWRSWTFKTGLSEIIDALACTIEERGGDILFNAECSKLTFKDNKALLEVENEKIEVDHVFSCIPADQLSKLLHQYSSLAETLMSISSVDVAVVYFEFENNVLKKNGFGFLAPSFEDSKVLGVVFDSCLFPELNGKRKTRLTCMMGGRWFRDILGDPEAVSEELILSIALKEVQKHLSISQLPVRHKVVIQRNCIPQYVVGHHKKLIAIDNDIKKHNLCLTVLGASYEGAGVPDCIYTSKLGVQKYLESLQ